jgi:peptide chain release factor 1
MDRLSQVEEKFEELGRLLSDPDITRKQDKLRKYSKEHSDLAPVVNAYRKYRHLETQLGEVEIMLREEKDSEVVSMIREDPMDDKNTIIEVRAGTGGDEASLFVGDLVRMYSRYAERKGWKWEFLSTSPTELGGYIRW